MSDLTAAILRLGVSSALLIAFALSLIFGDPLVAVAIAILYHAESGDRGLI